MNIDKMLKPNRKFLIVSLVLFFISIGLYAFSFAYEKIINKKALDYNELIANKTDEEGKYATIKIAELPYLFAKETKNNVERLYYVAFDANNYMYIVRLTEKTYKDMEEKYKEDENYIYTLKGYIHNDEDKLKKLAMDWYNESMPSEEYYITNENFESYLGKTYLDETKRPNNLETAGILCIAIGFVLDILVVIFVIGHITSEIRYQKVVRKYNMDELRQELMEADCTKYDKLKIYFTRNYFISNYLGLTAIPYTDLVWVYNERWNRNGLYAGTYLLVYTRDKEKQRITFSKDEEQLIAIMNELIQRNNQIMVGYTKENAAQYRAFKRQ